MEPLSAIQRITAHVIIRGSRGTIGRMNLVRTWRATCRGRQVVGRWWLLLLRRRRRLRLLARRLAIGFGMLRCRQWLTVRTVHGRRLSNATPDRVGRHKSLRLG